MKKLLFLLLLSSLAIMVIGCKDDATDTGNTGDTANTGDSTDTGNTADSADSGNTADTGNTGNSADSGNTSDTGNTGNTGDTADTSDTGNTGDPVSTLGDHTVAKESVFRAIPQTAIEKAKNDLRIAYFHSSHGSRVISGMDGLVNYKAGDDSLYAFTKDGSLETGKLSIDDNNSGGNDLSSKDTIQDNGHTQWYNETVEYLTDAANSHINVVMWSWCDPGGHDHQQYLDDMEVLITDYPAITFVFMTGHPNGDGESESDTSAYHAFTLISAHAKANNRWLIDYWDIETHDMNDAYYPDADDNGVEDGTEFYKDWQTDHPGEFFENSCAHTDDDQELTCNRKAYAAWWIWARIAGWDGQ